MNKKQKEKEMNGGLIVPSSLDSKQEAGENGIQKPMTPEEQSALLRDNNRLLREIANTTKHLRWIHASRLVVTILIIVIPILGAIFVLPRILTGFTETFTAMTGGTGNPSLFTGGKGMIEIVDQFREAQDVMKEDSSKQVVPTVE